MRRKKIYFLILIFAISLEYGVYGFNLKSPEQKKEQQTLQHEVTVVLKLVQVFVVDKEGNPVTDLTKDDFIIYDNTKLQTITDFESHILFKPAEEKVDETLEEAKLPARQKAPLKSYRMNRKFLLILDMQRNSGRGVKASKKAALHFLDTQIQLPVLKPGEYSLEFIAKEANTGSESHVMQAFRVK